MRFNNDLMSQAHEQEKVRRGHHKYVPLSADGQHGLYEEVKYKHQEYPKMLGTWKRPEYKEFLKVNGVEVPAAVAHERFENAVKEWDAAMTASIVNSKAEEAEWLRSNR
jgi:hypothetical protein